MPVRFFRISVLSASLLVACTKSTTHTPTQIAGSYTYSGQGSTFSKPWRFNAVLDLRADRTFRLTLDKTIDGKRDPTESKEGTYSVDGDRVLLVEDNGKMEEDIHKLRIRPDSLIGELGWTAQAFLKGVGAPNLVFVRLHRS